MKVFVAGHRGMVGNSLLRNAPRDTECIVVDRTRVDLRERGAVLKFLALERPEAIMLAAARVGGIEANSRHQKQFLLENLQIQDAVIGGASTLGIQNLIFLGSSCIYPKLAPQPIPENSLLTGPLEPTNEGYALAKIAGIRLCRAIYEEEGLNYFSLMPTNLYGPNDNYDAEMGHVPAALMRKFHEAKVGWKESVSVWGTGTPRREFMHVDDLASACWFLLERNCGGELFNIGTGTDISITEFARLMSKVVGFEGKIDFDTSRPDGTPRKWLDSSKLRGLGWEPRIELEQGLRRTYEWFSEALTAGEVRGY